MSEEHAPHWLDSIDSEPIREGFLQLALSGSLRECILQFQESTIKGDQDLAEEMSLLVREPLESESWLPSIDEKRSILSSFWDQLNGSVSIPKAVDALATHFLAGSATDLEERLVTALDAAVAKRWSPTKLPDKTSPVPVWRGVPGRLWANMARALRAWRRVEHKVWRRQCERVRIRIRHRNEEGSWLAGLAWLHSSADYHLFADAAKLLDVAMTRPQPEPNHWLDVALPQDWKPAILADGPEERIEAAATLPIEDVTEAWQLLIEPVQEAELTEVVVTAPTVAEKKPLTIDQRLEPIHRLLEKQEKVRDDLRPALTHFRHAWDKLYAPQASEQNCKDALMPLLERLGVWGRNSRAVDLVGQLVKELNAVLQESPYRAVILHPDLKTLGTPIQEKSSVGTRPVATSAENWGRVVGFQFGLKRKDASLVPWVTLVGVGLPEPVVKSVSDLLGKTKDFVENLKEHREATRSQLYQSEEQFLDGFREFYREYFRHYYDNVRPPEGDPIGAAFDAVCKALGMTSFKCPETYGAASDTDLFVRVRGQSNTSGLDWHIHPGWKKTDGTIFLQARAAYR